MAKNDFKPFATGAGANVLSQSDWETLPALPTGFQSGKAASAQVNKAIRQASFIAAALAQYTANKSGSDVLDDGDITGFITKMSTAFGKDFQALDATLTALAGLVGAANKLAYFNGADTAVLTDLTQVGRDIIGKNAVADVLSYLGLGGAAKLAAAVATQSSQGYLTIPALVGGVEKQIIIQWGQASNIASTTSTATFPIAFPNACLQVVLSGFQVGGSLQAYGVLNSSSLTGFSWNAFYAGSGVAPVLSTLAGQVQARYIAIGW